MNHIFQPLPLQQIQFQNEKSLQRNSKDIKSKQSLTNTQDKKEKLLQGFCQDIKIRNIGKPIDLVNTIVI